MNLQKMTEINFEKYQEQAIFEYANDKIKAGTWEKTKAVNLAVESYNNLLPEGSNTPDNYLFSIIKSNIVEPIGMIWVKRTGSKIFIYDFVINANHRGKGYGKESLKLLENWAIEEELEEIGLHVFAHNISAHQLYKKMGYVETDITMVRNIKF